jgi:hypothetical protein
MAPRRVSWTSGAAAAAAALAVVTMLQWNAAERLRSDLQVQRRQLAEAERRLAEERRWGAMSAPDGRVAGLIITPAGVQACAHAPSSIRRRQRGPMFEHFTPPPGKATALAMRPDGSPACVIKVDEQGRAIMRMENLARPTRSPASLCRSSPKVAPNPRPAGRW